jgi:hypothetical protein
MAMAANAMAVAERRQARAEVRASKRKSTAVT